MLGLTWKCKNCNYEVLITDGWEFSRDHSQKRKRYSTPIPISSPVIADVEGFSSDLYCPQCQDVRDVVVEDFKSAVTAGRQDASSLRNSAGVRYLRHAGQAGPGRLGPLPQMPDRHL